MLGEYWCYEKWRIKWDTSINSGNFTLAYPILRLAPFSWVRILCQDWECHSRIRLGQCLKAEQCVMGKYVMGKSSDQGPTAKHLPLIPYRVSEICSLSWQGPWRQILLSRHCHSSGKREREPSGCLTLLDVGDAVINNVDTDTVWLLELN